MATHLIAFLLNSVTLSCINTLHYEWEGIPRLCEGAVRFHMLAFIKMKGEIKKKMLNILLFLA